MGKRVNYEITGVEDEGVVSVAAILYSNSSHPTEDPEEFFVKTLNDAPGRNLNDVVAELLTSRYQTDGGIHNAGDRMFDLDLYPGHRECVLRASVAGSFENWFVTGSSVKFERLEADGLTPIQSEGPRP